MSDLALDIRSNTPSKLEITVMAARLSLTRDDVFGKCVRLWLWAKSNATDGFAKHATAKTVDDEVGCAGFAEAMESVGWLQVRDGAVFFPKFDRLAGKKAPIPVAEDTGQDEKRVKARDRVRRFRQKKRDGNATERNGNADVTPCNANVTPLGVGGELDSSSSKAKDKKQIQPLTPTPSPGETTERIGSTTLIRGPMPPAQAIDTAAKEVIAAYVRKVTGAHSFQGKTQVAELLSRGVPKADLLKAVEHFGAWHSREGTAADKRVGAVRFFADGMWEAHVAGVPAPSRGVAPVVDQDATRRQAEETNAKLRARFPDE